jgi:hypothetical protein
MLIHHKDTRKQRKIIRAKPEEVGLIYRKNRFKAENFIINYNESDSEKISFNNWKTEKVGRVKINVNTSNISSEIDNKYTTIHFNVLPGYEIKFLLLNSFFKELTINLKEMDFKPLVQYLNKELDLYADSINRFNIYKNRYLCYMHENNFCNYILKMYTEEGFLYRIVNKILRKKDVTEFKKIQCYYFVY